MALKRNGAFAFFVLLALVTLLPFVTWEVSSRQNLSATTPDSARRAQTRRGGRRARRDVGRRSDARAAVARGRRSRRYPPRNSTTADANADARPIVAFLHIGKTGGTSFDKLMKGTVRDLGRQYAGNRHFDWSYIDLHFGGASADVVTLLRDPVSRAVSHFYFARNLPWTKGKKIRTLSLSEYLKDGQIMMDTRTVWQDGQAAVRWLTGTKIARSVATNPAISVDERERLAANTTHMCLLAAERLNQTAWFGVLERLDESMDMLASVLGLPEGMSLDLPKANSGKYPAATAADREALTSLMPMDNWLYGYARMLFEARLTHHRGGPHVDPPLPPLPDITCYSNRFALECERGPLAKIFPRDLSKSSVYEEMRQR